MHINIEELRQLQNNEWVQKGSNTYDLLIETVFNASVTESKTVVRSSEKKSFKDGKDETTYMSSIVAHLAPHNGDFDVALQKAFDLLTPQDKHIAFVLSPRADMLHDKGWIDLLTTSIVKVLIDHPALAHVDSFTILIQMRDPRKAIWLLQSMNELLQIA